MTAHPIPLLRWFTLLILALLWCVPPANASDDIATIIGQIAPETPLEADVGVLITQITGVDQKAENFGVVARIRMRWQDDQLAFDPEEAGTPVHTLSGEDFLSRARELGLQVPVATIENQQTRSFVKASTVAWFPDGTAIYLEEVIVTLQAPDFDFRQFPFDHQSFYFRVVADAPVNFVRLNALEKASGLGETLGEEEWVIDEVWTQVDEVEGLSGLPSSRYSLGFSAERHLLYYWARIFVPLILLMGIAWANLFLEEYRRRIDIASGNLLAFIAFNFTISGELPRLGYMTFLDSMMMGMFIITAGAVAYNVALRRASLAGHEDRARAIDWHVTWWGFPALIGGIVVAIALAFL